MLTGKNEFNSRVGVHLLHTVYAENFKEYFVLTVTTATTVTQEYISPKQFHKIVADAKLTSVVDLMRRSQQIHSFYQVI